MMDEGRVVVDTTVVSHIFNGHTLAPFYVDAIVGRQAFISFQTLEEIRFGALKRGWGSRRTNEMAQHLRQYRTVWANPEIVELCAQLRHDRERAGRALGRADAWIAATAILLDCPVASHDRDFSGIPGLELIRAPSP